VPGVPEYRLDPEVVLIGVLPSLLHAAALRTSLVDMRANRQAMGILAVGAVIFTTIVVGVIAWLDGRGSRPHSASARAAPHTDGGSDRGCRGAQRQARARR
jgi:NhaP-type Na+/H+ or K+/H+ antiporter